MHTFNHGLVYQPGSAGMFFLAKLAERHELKVGNPALIRNIPSTNEYNVGDTYKFWPNRIQDKPNNHQVILQAHHVPYDYIKENDVEVLYMLNFELCIMSRVLFLAKRLLAIQPTEFIITWLVEQVRSKESRQNKFWLGKELPKIQQNLEKDFPLIFQNKYDGDWLPRLGDFRMPPLCIWTFACWCEDNELEPNSDNFVKYLNDEVSTYINAVERPGTEHFKKKNRDLLNDLHSIGKVKKIKHMTYIDQINFNRYEIPYLPKQDFIDYHNKNLNLLNRIIEYTDSNLKINKQVVNEYLGMVE